MSPAALPRRSAAHSLCMYIYVYIRMYVCEPIYMFTYTWIMYICIHAYMNLRHCEILEFSNSYMHVYTHIHAYMNSRIRVFQHVPRRPPLPFRRREADSRCIHTYALYYIYVHIMHIDMYIYNAYRYVHICTYLYAKYL